MRIRALTLEDYGGLIALWEASELPYRPRGRDQRDRIGRELEGDGAVFRIRLPLRATDDECHKT